MPFDWTEYLRLARSLNGDDEAVCGEEGRHRSAVSRAYYAAFCVARNYARDSLGFYPNYDTRDHADIRREYANAAGRFDGEERKRVYLIPIQLDNLRQWRNNCDYRDSHPNLPTTVRLALREAASLLETLANLRT